MSPDQLPEPPQGDLDDATTHAMTWWQTLLAGLAGVTVGHVLSRLQGRSDREAARVARWSEIGAPALVKVRRFLAEASPEVVGAEVKKGDEESAKRAVEVLAEVRMAYIEPLLLLADQHPRREVRELATQLTTDCQRVMNSAGRRIRSRLTPVGWDVDRETRAAEWHEIATKHADQLATLLRGEQPVGV